MLYLRKDIVYDTNMGGYTTLMSDMPKLDEIALMKRVFVNHNSEKREVEDAK
jgi:hypothetical protein